MINEILDCGDFYLTPKSYFAVEDLFKYEVPAMEKQKNCTFQCITQLSGASNMVVYRKDIK